MYQIYEDLENDRVHAALLDSYSTASESKWFSEDWLRVIQIIPVRYESANGLVLTGDVMKLAQCFRSYVRSETSYIHRIIQSHVGSIEVRNSVRILFYSSHFRNTNTFGYVKQVRFTGIGVARIFPEVRLIFLQIIGGFVPLFATLSLTDRSTLG